ncbi:hypothetical protein ACFQ3P_19280 [Paraburkholderia sabiae]|uniref:DUF1273 domain-containing protein n=1 Tax=Paraburkholderia sabiae TaxID=273251 RepID=A0ABU9QBC8_9BURK|nr:hypothetical protein [Paraburkholderia sabiae]WJZ72409.1 hypothetical protein QEN71_19840 [Paraburkholderia sabiae]CAD6537011.1 hypothetical protein LMG24235_03165 [Paraburkholderia sabiae]
MPKTALRRAFLFSGHMIDAPDRAQPRFPPQYEPRVAAEIGRILDLFEPTADDVAIGSGACGSDILFGEAMIARGVPLRLHLPFDEAVFIEKSVRFAGEQWVERYRGLVKQAVTLAAPDQLGPLRAGDDPYERANLWMLAEAQRLADGQVVFLCVWDGQGADGPGGTKHMVDVVQEGGGEVEWIDIRGL